MIYAAIVLSDEHPKEMVDAGASLLKWKIGDDMVVTEPEHRIVGTLFERGLNEWRSVDAITVIKPSVTEKLIDDYIYPSVVKLVEFNLDQLFSVDVDLISNNKFTVTARSTATGKLPVRVGVTVYHNK